MLNVRLNVGSDGHILNELMSDDASLSEAADVPTCRRALAPARQRASHTHAVSELLIDAVRRVGSPLTRFICRQIQAWTRGSFCLSLIIDAEREKSNSVPTP